MQRSPRPKRALKMQGCFTEAFDAFQRAVWNTAWQEAAKFELARLASWNRDFAKALDYVDRAAAMMVPFVIFGAILIGSGISGYAN